MVAAAAAAAFLTAASGTAVAATSAAAIVTAAVANTAISVGLSLAAQALAPKPGQTKTGVRYDPDFEPDRPRSLIFGRAVTAGSLVYEKSYGGDNNRFLNRVISIADHECDGLEGLYINNELVTVYGTESLPNGTPIRGTETEHSFQKGSEDRLWYRFFSGASGQSADALLVSAHSSDWSNSDVGTNVAYLRLHARYSQKQFPQGRPSPRAIVRGLKCYDPRKDSTAGGSGAHRWGQPETYEWTDNPILIAYMIVRGIPLGGGVSWGLNTPTDAWPVSSVAAEATLCDTLVADGFSGTQKRFRVGFEALVSDEPRDYLIAIADNIAGLAVESAGYYRLLTGVSRTSVASITDDDLIIEPTVHRSERPASEAVNRYDVTYLEPVEAYARKALPTIAISGDLTADGGFPLSDQAQLDLTQHAGQARRVQEFRRARGRREISHDIVLPPSLRVLEVGDWITWTSDQFAYTSKSFEVQSVGVRDDFFIPLTIREVASADYGEAGSLPEPTPSFAPGVDTGFSTVSGLAAVAFAIVAGDETRPAIEVSWIPVADERIRSVIIEYRPTTVPTAVQTYVHPTPASGFARISAGVQGGVTYEVRATIETVPPRETTFTAWVATTAALVRTVVSGLAPANVGFDQLEGELRERIYNRSMEDADDIVVSFAIEGLTRGFNDLIKERSANFSIDLERFSRPQTFIDVDRKIEVERVERRDKFLIVDAEIAALETDVASVTTSITTLQTQVGTDVAAVNQAISTETTRNDVRSFIATQIAAQSMRNADDAAVAIFQEALSRDAVDADVKRRVGLANANISRVEQVTVTQGQAIATVETALTAEVNGRLSAEATLVATQQTLANTQAAQATSLTELATRVTGTESTNTSQATAISGLDTRVTAVEGVNTSQATSITSLTSRITAAEGVNTSQGSTITSQGTAISGLETRVTAAEGVNASQAGSITSLDSRLTSAEGINTSQATAITTLDTRVTSAEGVNTSQATAITTLNAAVSDAATGLAAANAAIATVDTARVSDRDADAGRFTRISSETMLEADDTALSVAFQAEVDSAKRNNVARAVSATSARIETVAITSSTANSALATQVTELTTRVTGVEGTNTSQGTAISGLDTRVTAVEGVNTSQATAITSLDSRITSAEGVNTSQATAINLLDTRVTAAEGVNTSQSSAITSLDSRVTAAESTSTSQATAISGLDTRVSAAEGVNTSQATSITNLTSRMTSAEGVNTTQGSTITAQGTAISGLDTRVTAVEGVNTTQSSAITSLDSRVTAAEGVNTSQATAIAGLDTRVTAAEGVNTSQATAITSLDSRVTGTESTNTSQATAITNLDTRVTSVEGVNTSQGTAITSLTSRMTSAEGVNTSQATALTGLETRITSAEGVNTSQASAIGSLEASVNNPTTGLAAAVARVSTIESAYVTSSAATAIANTRIAATFDNTASGYGATLATSFARTASGQVGFAVQSTAAGAVASYSITLQAGTVTAGMRFDALSGGLSRVVLDAGEFRSNTETDGQANWSINSDGTITARRFRSLAMTGDGLLTSDNGFFSNGVPEGEEDFGVIPIRTSTSLDLNIVSSNPLMVKRTPTGVKVSGTINYNGTQRTWVDFPEPMPVNAGVFPRIELPEGNREMMIEPDGRIFWAQYDSNDAHVAGSPFYCGRVASPGHFDPTNRLGLTEVAFWYPPALRAVRPLPWRVPLGWSLIDIEVWGPGGAGGESGSNRDGGPGGFSSGRFAVSPGQVLLVVPGRGGDVLNLTRPFPFGGRARSTRGLDENGGGGLAGVFLGTISRATAWVIAGGGGGCARGEGVGNNGKGGAGNSTESVFEAGGNGVAGEGQDRMTGLDGRRIDGSPATSCAGAGGGYEGGGNLGTVVITGVQRRPGRGGTGFVAGFATGAQILASTYGTRNPPNLNAAWTAWHNDTGAGDSARNIPFGWGGSGEQNGHPGLVIIRRVA